MLSETSFANLSTKLKLIFNSYIYKILWINVYYFLKLSNILESKVDTSNGGRKVCVGV